MLCFSSITKALICNYIFFKERRTFFSVPRHVEGRYKCNTPSKKKTTFPIKFSNLPGGDLPIDIK
jgi:hypothetical protein